MEIVKRYRHVHEDVDRHGNPRIYFWRGKGHKRIRIRALPGTEAFDAAYAAALAQDTSTGACVAKQRIIQPGTFRWLCARYISECADFLRCTEETRRVRRRVIETMLLEPRKPGSTDLFADFPLNRLTAQAITILRDRKRTAPEAANTRLKALRQLFAWACSLPDSGMAFNPARDVKFFRTATEGHHTWTRDEVYQFIARHPLGTRAHLAMSIMLYTGVRISDLAQMGPQMLRDGWLYFIETKGRTRIVKPREILVLPILQEAIDAHTFGHLHFMVTAYGKPFSIKGLGQWFKDRCIEAGLPHCSAHGLRKAGATIATENGATEQELMAIFGWETSEQADGYTRKVNRRRLVARSIHKIRLDE
ncbi:tyrosine-type recombinase/integrase [Pleomorphomonas koreensis]|uniref:tyrosine-type recombinase/integrase n=1 Tax=Pleomorphomonas koreensis TaxID=257440 RepID=UPI00047BB80D|nr:tyrosine-type recombinase/integrase [Pleomorphomonas koreensis]